jgi:hypothetical protein
MLFVSGGGVMTKSIGYLWVVVFAAFSITAAVSALYFGPTPVEFEEIPTSSLQIVRWQ